MSEVLEALDIQPSDTVVDATIGGAGHFATLLAALGEGGVIVGVDADPGDDGIAAGGRDVERRHYDGTGRCAAGDKLRR